MVVSEELIHTSDAEPAFNEGQQVVWVCGDAYPIGSIHILTKVVRATDWGGAVSWYIRLNDGFTDFYPGRVRSIP